jgi:hypothetical protein
MANSWVLSDSWIAVFDIIKDYRKNFGECINKLKIMINIARMAYRISFLFVSDGTFDRRIRYDILGYTSEKAMGKLLGDFKRPYCLERKNLEDDEICILEVIKVMMKEVKKELDDGYIDLWGMHVTPAA